MSSSDESEIRNLLARLARMADTGTMDEYLGLFAEDAVMEVPGGEPRVGHAALRAGSQGGRDAGFIGPGSHTMHVLGAAEVTVDGDRGTATAPFVFVGGCDGSPTVMTAGRYHDELRRTAEGWKLAHRRVAAGG